MPALSMERSALDLWNAAMGHAERRIALDVAGASFSFCVAVGPPAPHRSGYVVRMAPDLAILLFIDDFPFDEWAGSELSYHEAEQLSEPVRTAIDRGILDIVRGHLPGPLNERIQDLSRLEPGNRPEDPLALGWVEVSLFAGTQAPARFTLGLDPAALGSIVGPVAPGGGPGVVRLFSGLRVPVTFSLGSIAIGLDEARGLAPGDMLVLDAESDPSVLYVTASHVRYLFTGADGNWTCREVRERLSARSDFPPGARESGMDARIDSIEREPNEGEAGRISFPVIVEFDLGEKTVPIGELETWRPGCIVEMEPPRAAENVAVGIRVNGRLIGSGDLVRLGDRLAVRIGSLTGVPQGTSD
jgi:type III secretion system YscQ/HrcQ family protein